MENNNSTPQNQNTNNTNSQVKAAINEKMAVRFPDWDLLPPALLINRGKNES